MSSLFEKCDDEYTVFRDKSLLSLEYVPHELVARSRQEERLARILVSGVKENYLPPMVTVFGPTGTGKTAVVRSVLQRLRARNIRIS